MVNSKTVSTLTTLDLEAPAKTRPKVGFVSLGCPKNLVDSEVMMGLLHHNGAQLTPDAEDAEIIVINTCSFIDSAKQESVNTILEMVQHKQAHGGKARRIVVAGCLVERYRDEIRKNIPEVDAVVGTGELEHILAAAGLSPDGPRFGTAPVQHPSTAIRPGCPIVPTASSPTGGPASRRFHGPPIPQPHPRRPRPDLHRRPPPARPRRSSRHPCSATPSSPRRLLRLPALPPALRPDAPQLRIAAQLEIVQSRSPKPEPRTAATPSPTPASTSPTSPTPTSPPATPAPSPRKPTSRPEGDARFAAGRFSRESLGRRHRRTPRLSLLRRHPTHPRHARASAYIKIAEGCDHPCTFCIIPQLRGKFRSRRIGSILAEAQNLIAQGVREITLIGQDTTCYGEDLGLAEGLAQLLDALAPLPGLRWLRFLYTYPNKVTTRLLETIARHATSPNTSTSPSSTPARPSSRP